MKKNSEIAPQEERLHKLLIKQSEELQQEIMAFFEEGQKQATIQERVLGVFRKWKKKKNRL